ncbi:MAG TPA: DNA polymerase domain-containing protein [Thermoplasmataceae archaeon]|nr:DNA polymerase domain-containing protein [Thermoplasmataceae archaeon]
MQIKMRILVASYRREDVAIELYGRTDDGRSVTALYFGFSPYFDIVEPGESCLAVYRSDPEYVSEKDLSLWVDGQNRSVKRIIVRSPWKVPELREKCGKKYRILAADIPFHHRFIYDMDLGPSVEIDCEEIESDRKRYTTDLVVKINSIRNTDDFAPRLKILSFDVENAIQTSGNDLYGEIFVIGYSIFDGTQWKKGHVTGREPDLLKEFVKVVQTEDPDILTGYNIDGYDLPVIKHRMEKYGIRMAIGRDKTEPHRVMGQYWRLHGRTISDTWWAVKKVLHPKHETLNYVAKELLGEGKDNINRLKIEEEWRNRQQEVIEYCIKDADLTLRIFNKLRMVDRNMFMSTVTKLPFDDVANGGTSNYVDSLLIRKADRENIGVPMTNHNLKEAPIEGGYVHSIGAGIYDNVIVLDFKSMYPSMIMKYNICFTTYDPNGTIVAPNGVKFLDPSVKRGLVPRLLKELMDQRDAVKRRMKSALPDEREYLDGIQGAIKILMNTFYGVLASSFYRFTNLDIGSAVTAYARKTITDLIGRLQGENYKVIYGDTDSIFIESGAAAHDDAIRIGRDLSERLSGELGVTLEFEKVMDPLFSHGAKKRYAGRIVYPESQKGEILVRGYEVRRTDSFDLQSQALSRVFDLILSRDIEGAARYAKEIVEKVRRGDASINIEDLVISRTVKDFNEYKEEKSLANVRVAKKLMERGETFIPGMKVSWIVTNSKKTPQEVEPYIDGAPFEFTPDWDYYARRIEETLDRVLEGIADDYREAMEKQTNLTNFTSESPEPKKQPEKAQKNLFEFN